MNGDNDPGEDPFAAPPSAYAYPLLLKHLLHSALRAAPHQEIVYRDLVRHDYLTLASRVAQLAHGLVQLGVRPGQTVAMLDWDSHRYLESYFAIPGIGAVLHMVNIRLSPEQVLYTINHARDDVLLAHAEFLPLIESIADRIERPCKTIVLSDDGIVPATAVPIAGEYEALLATGDPDFAFSDFDENSRATTFYTTGTTGLPKGVFFSHRQLVLHTLSGATMLGVAATQGRLHRGDVYMPITPMFHVHAWGLPFVATMLGIKQVYPGRYAPDVLLELIVREGVTFTHGVPTILQMLLSWPGSSEVDLSRLKMVVGGSALSKGLAKAALDRGIDVFTGYGMSETCPLITLSQLPASPVKDELEVRTRTGLSLPLVDLQIVDDEMKPVSRKGFEAGEIVVRAPWLTQSYVRDRAASERLWQGGYMHTGDIGHIGEDGYLQVTDRLKDVIKSGGEWISSLEVEDIISQHPGVAEVAVIGVPDTKWGERPIALVVPRAGWAGAAMADELKLHLETFHLRGQLSKWAIPSRIILTDALSKTSVGKLDKKAMRSKYNDAV